MIVVTPAFASGLLEEKAGRSFDLSGKASGRFGITLRYNGNTQKEFFVEGPYVSARTLFEHTTDQITWEHNSKVAVIEKNGKQLVIAQDKEYKPSANQIVLPSSWSTLVNGRTMIKFPYLAYIFDRYLEHDDHSEAALWKEKLDFLEISYIDNNDSTAKDGTIHSFIQFTWLP